jgi:hypothetical protein
MSVQPIVEGLAKEVTPAFLIWLSPRIYVWWQNRAPLPPLFMIDRRVKSGHKWNRRKPDPNYRRRRKSDPRRLPPHFELL